LKKHVPSKAFFDFKYSFEFGRQMTNKIVLLSLLLLAGCTGVKPVHFDGRSATLQHSESDFADAMRTAKEQCANQGKGIKHDRTDCGSKCVSTFVCLER
jgi:hypothetical protein